MIRLEMENCCIASTEKQQDYQLYHLEKLMINMNILQVKTSSDQRRVIEQAIFVYSPLEKAF